jgi:gliding motility-associated-like protein
MRPLVIFLLTVFFSQISVAQSDYNVCSQALELCPNVTVSVTNIGANKTVCPGCEDDFNFCFTANNTIWFKFTTNTVGGTVQIDFTNLVFQPGFEAGNALQATMFSASLPCDPASYTAVGNCVSSGSTPFTLTATLNPSTTYYLVVSGESPAPGLTTPAECTFDLTLSGVGVDRTASSISITTNDTSICPNEVLTATASLSACPDSGTYQWFINGVLVAVTTDSIFQTSTLADGDVLSVQNACYAQCPVTVTSSGVAISVYALTVNAGPDMTIQPGESVQLNGSSSSATFIWSPAFGVSDTNSLTPFVSPEITTVYALTATENGCTLQDQVVISVASPLFFPNTFSPDNDGTNDTWEIIGINVYTDCFVKIFDRWGQEVFQSVGYSSGKAWDGTHNGNPLNEGVYFYIIELRDAEEQVFNGSITLVR